MHPKRHTVSVASGIKGLSSGGSITTRFDYGWIDDFQTHQDSRFQASVGANDAYGKLSSRITYVSPDGKWDVAIFGTNSHG